MILLTFCCSVEQHIANLLMLSIDAVKLCCIYTDIDECQTDNGRCSHICVNADGFHSCKCPPYLYLSEDNVTCTGTSLCLLYKYFVL